MTYREIDTTKPVRQGTEYGESYYTSKNYAGYLERSTRYERMVSDIHHDVFRRVGLDFVSKPVLDFGCAAGFTVASLGQLGYKYVTGYDVSDWAVQWGRANLGLNNLTTNVKSVEGKYWALMLAFDVFEHMNETALAETLSTLKPDHILVRIPVSETDGGRYVLSVSEADKTHIIRLTKSSWCEWFSNHGYTKVFGVNTGGFYDSDGVMCAMFRKSSIRW
jgi:2-polyprenyl-3-methyl-5-hydroxy-6-metoxy-1,4-benzoquinol methylase